MTETRDAAEPTYHVAGEENVGTILAFMRDFYVLEGNAYDEGMARRALLDFVRDPSLGRAWLIRLGEETIGYVVLTFGYSLEYRGRDAFIDEFFIAAAHRGRGLGAKVLRFVDQACRDFGVRALHLEVGRKNAGAQALYRKHGFEDHDRCLLTRWISR